MNTACPENNLALQGNDDASQERSMTIAQRLAQRKRFFLEGPSNLSERETRKRIACNSVSERHQARS